MSGEQGRVRMRRMAWTVGLAMTTVAAGAAMVASATSSDRWVVDTAAELLAGEGEGVAVTTDGRLEATAVWRSGAVLEEPVAMAADTLPGGDLVVGTGHPARLYRITGSRHELLAEVPGEQVTAVLALGDDEVLVATAAPAALHRYRRGSLETVGELADGGIWDLAQIGDTVVAAAGPPATLYRVGQDGLERWLELPDAHARCLVAGADGDVVVGTSGKGLVFRVTAGGAATLLLDSPFTEISDLVSDRAGVLWAAALVGEPVQPTSAAKDAGGDSESTVETASVSLDLPKVNGSTATSEVVRITADGAVLSVHRFDGQVASALAVDGDGVLVGTGFGGEIWRFVAAGGARLATVDAVQVVAFGDHGRAALTQGPGSVLLRAPTAEPGTFRGPAESFPRPVRLGRYGILSPTEGVRIRFRSGASAKPDESWLPWTEWRAAADGPVELPTVSSLQWELEIGPGRTVERVEVAYREVNLPPTVTAFDVEEPGVVYLMAPPPSGPVLDADHPDASGIFAVLEENGDSRSKAAKGKKFWRVGYRTAAWDVADPNSDPLRVDLAVEAADGFVLPVRERIEGSQLGVDTTAVPDGRYRFRLAVSDAPGNPGDAATTAAISEWFEVDNTAPAIEIVRAGGSWRVRMRDAGSAIAKAEWSRDGERWEPLAPQDGVLDGPEEAFELAAASGRHLVVVRAFDRHHNRATASVTEE